MQSANKNAYVRTKFISLYMWYSYEVSIAK